MEEEEFELVDKGWLLDPELEDEELELVDGGWLLGLVDGG